MALVFVFPKKQIHWVYFVCTMNINASFRPFTDDHCISLCCTLSCPHGIPILPSMPGPWHSSLMSSTCRRWLMVLPNRYLRQFWPLQSSKETKHCHSKHISCFAEHPNRNLNKVFHIWLSELITLQLKRKTVLHFSSGVLKLDPCPCCRSGSYGEIITWNKEAETILHNDWMHFIGRTAQTILRAPLHRLNSISVRSPSQSTVHAGDTWVQDNQLWSL